MLNNGSNATISTSVVVMLVLASGLYFGKENISDFLSNTPINKTHLIILKATLPK
jgi:hypothetical protein